MLYIWIKNTFFLFLSRLSGRASLMFYGITKHLIQSLSNYFILCVGFSFGFFVMSFGKDEEKFENPLKSIVKTMTMMLGELDFDDLYTAHEGDTYSQVSLSVWKASGENEPKRRLLMANCKIVVTVDVTWKA